MRLKSHGGERLCNFFKTLSAICTALCVIIFSLVYLGQKNIPDRITTIENSTYEFKSIFGVSLFRLNYENEKGVASGTARASHNEAEIDLLNIIPVKTAEITNSKRKYVVLGGELFGVKLYTDGVLVVDTDSVETQNGNVNPAEKAGLKVGDIIKSVNNEKVTSTKALAQKIEKSNGEKMSFNIVRNNRTLTIDFSTYKDINTGKYKAGLWVRDSTAGLGTVTFYNSEAESFAGLGHGIYDVDTNEIMPMNKGEVFSAYVNGIYKSSAGSVGELCGVITGKSIGELCHNNEMGVYGFTKTIKNESIPVAVKQEVTTGAAKIYCTLDDSGVRGYDIEIKKIYTNSDSVNKDMIIEVTDKALLEKTGGIVQGMSGSPIIQNGKLVGAVTHVFVNDPKKGYAIFVDRMVDVTENMAEEKLVEDAA